MVGVLYRLIKLVGACGTSSSTDSHITYLFFKLASDVSGKVQIIIQTVLPTPGGLLLRPTAMFTGRYPKELYAS